MYLSAQHPFRQFAAALLALAAALLRVQAQDELLIKELVSREYSIHVGGMQTPEIREIASREVSVFVLTGPAGPYHEAVSREVSVAVTTPEPPPPVRPVVRVSPAGDRVDLDWSAYNPWAVRDVARFDVYLSDHPFTTVAGLTPVASVNGESTAATLTGLPTFRDHFLAVVGVDALGNAEPVVTYTGAYVISPEVASREVSVFVGAEPVPAYREVVSREVSIVLTTPEPPAAIAKVATRGTPSGSGATLDWSAYDPWAERDVARFDIYFSDRPFTNVATMTRYASVPGEALFTQLDGLPEFRDHFFAVVPVDALGKFGPAVNYSGVYVISPEVVSREVSLFVGAEPDPPYRQVASREVSLLVADSAVPDPVTGAESDLTPATSETALGAIDLDWTKYNEVQQHDVVRYRVYWDTAYFDNVTNVLDFAYVAGGAQTYVLSGLNGNGIYFVAVVAEDAYGQFDPVVQSTLAQASAALEAPFFLSQPAGRSVKVGVEVTFAVTVGGTQPFTYRWYHDGYRALGAMGPTLTLSSVRAADSGSYTVEVEGGVGRTLSDPARLEVLEPPFITVPPRPATVRAGGTVSFSVGAEGTPPFSFDWLFNGVSLGAPNQPELVLGPLTSAHSGLISVRVTNAVGLVSSPEARLRVIEPVHFTRTLPALTNVDRGVKLDLSVEVAGTEPFEFQWRLNGQDLPGETNAVYHLPSVELKHAGSYTVVVVNEAGAVTSDPAEVRINLPERPGNDTWALATDLSLVASPVSGSNAQATHEPNEPNHAGQPGQHSVWYRWTSPVAGRLNVSTLGSAFDTLLAVYTGGAVTALQEVASNDDAVEGGFFTSEVSFSAAAGVTYFIALDGLGAEAAGNYVLSWDFVPAAPPVPQITGQPESQTAVPGGRVVLRVSAANATNIGWQFNGAVLPGVSGSPLVLDPVVPANVGTYVAVVGGEGGVVYSHPAVVELGPQAGVRSYDKPEEGEALAAPVRRVERQGVEGPPALALAAGRSVVQWVNNAVDTTQLREPDHCGQLFRRTGALKLQAVEDGSLVVRATNTTVPVVLALYAYPDLRNPAACGTGTELVLMSAKAGQVYRLVFGSADETGGLIALECTAGTPVPPPPTNAPALVTDVGPDQRVTLSAPAVMGLVPEPRYQWYRNGQVIPGAMEANLVIDRFTTNEAGKYSVVLDNGVGRGEFPIGELQADLPLTAGGSLVNYTAEGFGFGILGNPGQRVAVDRGYDLGQWSRLQEAWLPPNGWDFRDSGTLSKSGFYRVVEVPLTVVPEPPLTDGRVGWRVTGGRLGRSYELQRSVDGTSWTTVQTNRIEEGDFHLWGPAGFQFRTTNAPVRAAASQP